jgi:enediyne core biosynthesis thioesterase
VAFTFDYVRVSGAADELVARGQQRVLCMRADAGEMRPVRVPPSLRQALTPFLAQAS